MHLLVPEMIATADEIQRCEQYTAALFLHRKAPEKEYCFRPKPSKKRQQQQNVLDEDKGTQIDKEQFKILLPPAEHWLGMDLAADLAQDDWTNFVARCQADNREHLRFKFGRLWRINLHPIHAVLLRVDSASSSFVLWRMFRTQSTYSEFHWWWRCAHFKMKHPKYENWLRKGTQRGGPNHKLLRCPVSAAYLEHRWRKKENLLESSTNLAHSTSSTASTSSSSSITTPTDPPS